MGGLSLMCWRRNSPQATGTRPIHEETGELTPLETYNVGQRPMWVLTTRLGDA